MITPDNHTSVSVEPDGSTKLMVDSAKPDDSGKYVIEAINDSGSISTDTQAKIERMLFFISSFYLLSVEVISSTYAIRLHS